ncbi:NADH-quinone oxidoreductase subunit M, partial [Endobacter medicaginis]|nr:NADH-quinone oxidoreductase subunit M [Endobacter medicaginis]
TSRDLAGVELAALVPLALIVLWMGVYPTSFTRVFNPRVMAFAHPEAVASIAPSAQFR